MLEQIAYSVIGGLIADGIVLVPIVALSAIARIFGLSLPRLSRRSISLLVVAAFAVGCCIGLWIRPHRCAGVSRYTFSDKQSVEHWQASQKPDIQGTHGPTWSESSGADGAPGCLQASAHLVAGSTDRMKGELYVFMPASPPAGTRSPVDLSRCKVSCFVKWEGQAAGSWTIAPCMAAIFLRDEDGRAAYGRNHSFFAPPTHWYEISFWCKDTTHKDDGFNSKAINWIGVKFAANEKGTSTFEGTVYVDGITW